MLTRAHKILIGLLVIQVLLVAISLLRRSEPELVKDAPLLAGFDAAKVTRVRLFAASAEKPGVELAKKGASWALASHFDYPADPAKVKGVLDPLVKIAAGDPIATSASRHKQLRVADREFDRKLVLTLEGGAEKTILIGNPVGARRTAIRLGDDKVYAATEVPSFTAEPSGFVDTKYVDLPKADIERVAIRRGPVLIELAHPAPPAPAAGSAAGSAAAAAAGSAAGSAAAAAGSAAAAAGSAAAAAAPRWTATIDGAEPKLAAGESLDTDAIERVLGQIASIHLKAPGDPKRDAGSATAVISIHRKGVEQPVVLDVIADGETYWVHQRELDRAAIVDKSALSDAVGLDRDKLVKKPPPPGAGSAAPDPFGGPGQLPPGMAPPMPPGMPAPAPR
jgi:hypothetical protein